MRLHYSCGRSIAQKTYFPLLRWPDATSYQPTHIKKSNDIEARIMWWITKTEPGSQGSLIWKNFTLQWTGWIFNFPAAQKFFQVFKIFSANPRFPTTPHSSAMITPLYAEPLLNRTTELNDLVRTRHNFPINSTHSIRSKKNLFRNFALSPFIT